MNKEMLALFILVLGFGFVEFVVPKILRAVRKTKTRMKIQLKPL